MSSKANHRKRSHRSERIRRNCIGTFHSKQLYRQETMHEPKRENIFSRIKNKIFSKKGEK